MGTKKKLSAEERLAISNEALGALLALVRHHATEDALHAIELTRRSAEVIAECREIEAFRKGAKR